MTPNRVYSIDGRELFPVRECNKLQGTPSIDDLENVLAEEEAARVETGKTVEQQIAELIAAEQASCLSIMSTSDAE